MKIFVCVKSWKKTSSVAVITRVYIRVDFKEVTCIKDKFVKVIRMLKSTVYPDLMLK